MTWLEITTWIILFLLLVGSPIGIIAIGIAGLIGGLS